ncbi:MAG: DUF308 domain-containing protein [Actinobacteria bacterium]|nr:DUF308 domain-containing protein [Actinomycetota bacterium]
MSTSTPPPPPSDGPSGTQQGDLPTGTIVVDADGQAILERIGRAWWLVLILGIISVIVGAIVLVRPFTAVNVAAIIFGIWLLVSGVIQLAQAFNSRLETVARVLNGVTGLIGIVLGILCLESVENRISLLILFIGIWWIIRGIVQIIVGASGEGGGVAVFLGVVGLIAGIVLLVWPIATLTVLTVVVGIWLLVLGLFEIIAAFRVRSLNRQLN